MATQAPVAVDPTLLESWLRIRSDNTVAVRFGVADFGQGSVGVGLRQIVAEELRIPFEAVSQLVAADTDKTPDGGISAGVLNKTLHMHYDNGPGLHPDSPWGRKALNAQKVAAYAYQALLERAATALGAPVDSLHAEGGVISAGSESVSYAELVADAPLDVRFEVAGVLTSVAGLVVLGTPPVVPVSEYRVVGTSCPNPRIPELVAGRLRWVRDVRVPGMLHARVVHPTTLGSTLVSVGELDPAECPGAEVVVRGNLVAVVSQDEWEAVRAAEALAVTTTWSEWRGLPGSDRLVEAMLEADWSEAPVGKLPPHGDEEAVDAALARAPQVLSSVFSLPFYKHVPIGPEVAVADARSDGTVQIWASTQQPHTLRMKIANMLKTDLGNVVVHFVDGAGSFGRTTQGDAGPEAEAVIISLACGRPVRVQWSREDDFAWSAQQAGTLSEVSVGLDEAGRMVAFKVSHHQPGVNNDPLIGAELAGLADPPGDTAWFLNVLHFEWRYDLVPDKLELAHGARAFGQAASPINIGLRHKSMRSPCHLQQNFPVEAMLSEAAAAAGADPIQFRIDHTTDERLIGVLEAVRKLSGWDSRPSPSPAAQATGGGKVRGRGIGVCIRNDGYFAGVAEIEVDLYTGKVTLDRYCVAVDVGLVVNPKLLQLCIEGGSAMGLSQALCEELQFDRSAITSVDFRSYPILTMGEMPEIEVEILDRRDVMVAGQGAEPPNMVPLVALTGAFFDATGKHMRRLPLRPEYVLAELRGD
jgi:CO/xanthine dehydrogenase Mo-binding subunit